MDISTLPIYPATEFRKILPDIAIRVGYKDEIVLLSHYRRPLFAMTPLWIVKQLPPIEELQKLFYIKL